MKVLNCLKIPIKVNLSLLLVLPVVRSAFVEGVVLLLGEGEEKWAGSVKPTKQLAGMTTMPLFQALCLHSVFL